MIVSGSLTTGLQDLHDPASPIEFLEINLAG